MRKSSQVDLSTWTLPSAVLPETSLIADDTGTLKLKLDARKSIIPPSAGTTKTCPDSALLPTSLTSGTRPHVSVLCVFKKPAYTLCMRLPTGAISTGVEHLRRHTNAAALRPHSGAQRSPMTPSGRPGAQPAASQRTAQLAPATPRASSAALHRLIPPPGGLHAVPTASGRRGPGLQRSHSASTTVGGPSVEEPRVRVAGSPAPDGLQLPPRPPLPLSKLQLHLDMEDTGREDASTDLELSTSDADANPGSPCSNSDASSWGCGSDDTRDGICAFQVTPRSTGMQLHSARGSPVGPSGQRAVPCVAAVRALARKDLRPVPVSKLGECTRPVDAYSVSRSSAWVVTLAHKYMRTRRSCAASVLYRTTQLETTAAVILL
jgi:hypothetical protein